MKHTLPPILSAKFGNLRFIKKRTSTEYSAECPVCGDSGHIGNDWPDRFRMFYDEKPLGWCRQCGYIEFADGDGNNRPSPEQIKESQEIRRRLAEQERQRLKSKIARLQEDAYWRAYHDQMNDAHRAIWRKAGIPDRFQDYWELGFTKYSVGDIDSPALTIPYFAPGREATTIQYRLTNPPQKNDKYRFEAGLKADVWLAEPDEKPSGSCLMVEGMKKAGVTFIELVAKAGERLSIVAVPSKVPNERMLQRVKNCDPIYVALDPDAYHATKRNGVSAAARLGELLGTRARFVRLPAKPDDLFVDYGMGPRDFMEYIKQATRT